MNPISSPEVIDALLPSLGYFGGSMLDCLEIEVGIPVSSVRLEIDADEPSYLNLRGIELLGDDGAVDLGVHGYRIAQSSVQKNNEGRKNEALLQRKGIHSQREQRPSWEIWFDRPLFLRRIRLWNRADGCGARSRWLVVSAIRLDSTRIELYRAQSQETVERVLATVRHAIGLKFVNPSLLNSDTARLIRAGLIASLAQSAKGGGLAISARDWVDVVALTGIWSSIDPTDEEWTVLAAYLIAQKLESPGFGTSMKTMSLLLNTRAKLQRLEMELNKLGSISGLGKLMLFRHGVKPEGVLRTRSKAYIAHLKDVIGALVAADYDVVIAYGTLLGAVREGRFLSHDDDVDIIYRAKGGNRRAVEAEIVEVRNIMAKAGFRAVDLLPKNLNMHVSKGGGLVIDVFPCWMENDRLQMHMEGMAIRGIPSDILYPTGMIRLEGEEFPAPNDPKRFLRERYGPGWEIPDAYHDWPWKLRPD